MKYKALKDIATITMGQSPNSSSYNEEKNGMPFYQGNADFGELYPTARVWCSNPKKIAKENDILISVRAPIGALNYATEECCIGRGLAAITIENDAERNYVFHFLKAQNKELNNKGTGSTFKAISKSVLEEVQVPVISKEQQEISMKLMDIIEQIIHQRKQELQRLDELIQARFVEMFGSLNDNEKGLDILSIEELCTLIKDGTHQTPIYTDDKQNGVKFLSSKDVMTQKICWDEIKYIPAELHEKLYATIQPIRNDILMSKNGVNYGVAAVNDTDEIFDIYVSLALLRPKTDKVNPVYLKCAINNPDTKCQFDSSIKGIGVPNLHLGEIKKTKILVPSMDKQNTFVAFIEQVDKSKVAVQKALDETQLLFDSLMQKYFG